ncbi:hypothetical protein IFM89_021678 [Coptis chinensis]|uniref:Uncharacterized protein n=1 Tax=Coptis chinensis TaxID=261450 RepID=A0A835IED6_9MAGN|nr:hypothetical protein IFM89_021678 [Coptis chinensis]
MQEVWKVSTTAGSKRVKKGAPVHEEASSGNHSSRESEGPAKLSASTIPLISAVTNQSSTHGDASQASKLQNLKANIVCGSTPELRRTSSFDRTWEENVAETVGKSHDEKRARARKMREFHNIKISQVELLVIYEGSRFAGKKFKDKAHSQREPSGNAIPDGDLNFSDSDDGQAGKSDQFPISWLKRPSDGAGDGFVTSIRGLFNSQRRKAKAFVLRTMRGDADSEFHGEWSDSDVEFSPFARQLTITKARRLIRRHTKKFRSRGQKGTGSQQIESLPPSPRENTPFESDYSSESSPYEDFNE